MPAVINIPPDELEQFRSFMRVYTKGAPIVREGQMDDMCIFLLRQGEVEVLKQIGDDQRRLATIQAVNFFGEMAVVSKRKRGSTVIALSDTVVVYAFDNPNLSKILGNPKWGNLLLGRLVDNLRERTDAYEQTVTRLERQRQQVSEMTGCLLQLQMAALDDRSRAMLVKSIPMIIAAFLEAMDLRPSLPDPDQLRQQCRQGLFPEALFDLAAPMAAPFKRQNPNP